MKIRTILFYYSVLLSTFLFFWIILNAPQPESFILLILFFPIPFHFWLHASKSYKKLLSGGNSSHSQEGTPRKTRPVTFAALVLATLFISSISIFTYSLMYERYSPLNKTFSESGIQMSSANKNLKDVKKQLSGLEAVTDDILRQLSHLRLVTDQLKEEDKLGASDTSISNTTNKTATTSGLIKVNSNSDATAYDDRNPTSKIVGKAKAGEIYTFTQRVGVWYLISLLDFKEGWVSSEFLKEL